MEPGEPAAKNRNKMVKVEVRFWATDLNDAEGVQIQRHAWWDGYVRVPQDGAHGIKGSGQFFFDSPAEIGGAIERALIDADVRLHVGRTMRNKLYEP